MAKQIDGDLTITALQIVIPINPKSGRVTGVHIAPQHKWEACEPIPALRQVLHA